jgi:DNA-directed RNA polymerase subunit F
MNIQKEEVVTDVEAKEILESVKGELKYEQKNALEHLKKFVKSDLKTVKAVVEELKQNPNLRDKQIVEIINFLPEDVEDLRAVLQKDFARFSKEEIEKILEVVKKV